MKLNKEEKEIEALFERNEIALSKPDKKLLGQLRAAAEKTFRKDRRINIRLSDRGLGGARKKRKLDCGCPLPQITMPACEVGARLCEPHVSIKTIRMAADVRAITAVRLHCVGRNTGVAQRLVFATATPVQRAPG